MGGAQSIQTFYFYYLIYCLAIEYMHHAIHYVCGYVAISRTGLDVLRLFCWYRSFQRREHEDAITRHEPRGGTGPHLIYSSDSRKVASHQLLSFLRLVRDRITIEVQA